ncbi:DUF1127 domain-containing protein [Rhizobiaceae bacterium BDR2-2]|uniref:DUF1127 domain-containing protein n=1 Tax=Ectorhizobium quercum TaxID=2965071 RepID=A0AAE3N0F0_9HYPH|nr:DUF1127 domain-containing protein [Ectorhizobium quercum]MCX8997821.1 DUF1127 domain-containing protein [Ectorhizobium quercum]
MRKIDQYLSTIDTIYPDGYARESFSRQSGDMLDPRPLRFEHNRTLLSRLYAAWRAWAFKRHGRAVLRELSDEQLRDVGLTREKVGGHVRRTVFQELR